MGNADRATTSGASLRPHCGWSLTIAALLLAVLAMAAIGIAPVAADDTPDEPSLLVELNENGDATVTLISTYDLADDDERDAFRSLADDEDARDALGERFADRLDTVAADTATESDRATSVDGGSVEVETDGDVGIVSISVQWSSMAAVEDDRLVVTEPFASGFEPDRPLVTVAPDGYEVAETTPEPESVDGTTVRYAAGSDLTGFEVAFEPGDGADNDSTVDSLPGFGVVAALVALGLLVVGRTWNQR